MGVFRDCDQKCLILKWLFSKKKLQFAKFFYDLLCGRTVGTVWEKTGKKSRKKSDAASQNRQPVTAECNGYIFHEKKTAFNAF